ncbi:MAG: histidine--tRNA ligase [bacterium]|nr:histidine--tRNA ligase [bacterium]
MAELLTAQRGTADILPPAVQTWQTIEDRARAWFRRYDVDEIRTPIFEATELFARGLGEQTDVVSKEMYTFEDRGGRSITLRPEGTAGVVRAFLQAKLATPGAFHRFWYGGPMFRYERPQAGRMRQFHQIGLECLGADDPRVDAEAIALAVDLFADLGVQGLEVQLNSLGCPTCRPRFREALVAYEEAHRSAYCGTCQPRIDLNPLRVLDCKTPACQVLNDGAPSVQDHLCEGCRGHQEQVLACLEAVGVAVRLVSRLVRGLDYYTRTVFEIVAGSGLGSQNTVCAGGRYDGLVEECGGPPTPAFGWAFGIERLALLLGNRAQESGLELFIGHLGPAAATRAFALATGVRRAGDHRVAFATGDRKLKKLFEMADRAGARFVLVIGEDEVLSGKARLRDRATREEREIALEVSDLVEVLRAASQSVTVLS